LKESHIKPSFRLQPVSGDPESSYCYSSCCRINRCARAAGRCCTSGASGKEKRAGNAVCLYLSIYLSAFFRGCHHSGDAQEGTGPQPGLSASVNRVVH